MLVYRAHVPAGYVSLPECFCGILFLDWKNPTWCLRLGIEKPPIHIGIYQDHPQDFRGTYFLHVHSLRQGIHYCHGHLAIVGVHAPGKLEA